MPINKLTFIQPIFKQFLSIATKAETAITMTLEEVVVINLTVQELLIQAIFLETLLKVQMDILVNQIVVFRLQL